jgi:membrane associated rhomboid family serine protease
MLTKPKTSTTSALAELKREVKATAAPLGGMVGTMWFVELADTVFFRGGLDRFGVVPRTLEGLRGILFAPFLHGGFGHLAANTLPLLVLGFLIMLRRKRDLLTVSVVSTLVGGLGIWLLGASNSVHVGASILVFGYLGYLLARGVFERRFWPIVGSVAVFFFYGGALWGVLPGQAGISWEGHLFGLLGGILAAKLLATPTIAARERPRAALPR